MENKNFAELNIDTHIMEEKILNELWDKYFTSNFTRKRGKGIKEIYKDGIYQGLKLAQDNK